MMDPLLKLLSTSEAAVILFGGTGHNRKVTLLSKYGVLRSARVGKHQIYLESDVLRLLTLEYPDIEIGFPFKHSTSPGSLMVDDWLALSDADRMNAVARYNRLRKRPDRLVGAPLVMDSCGFVVGVYHIDDFVHNNDDSFTPILSEPSDAEKAMFLGHTI